MNFPRMTLPLPEGTQIDDAIDRLILAAHNAKQRVYSTLDGIEIWADPRMPRGSVKAQYENNRIARERGLAALEPFVADLARRQQSPVPEGRGGDTQFHEATRRTLEEPTPFVPAPDPEVSALVAMVKALALLDDDARARVIDYCHKKFGRIGAARVEPRPIEMNRGVARSQG